MMATTDEEAIKQLDYSTEIRCEWDVKCNNTATHSFRLICGHDVRAFCGVHSAQFSAGLLMTTALGYVPQCPESGLPSEIEMKKL